MEIIKCPECQRTVEGNVKFCPECGASLTASDKRGGKRINKTVSLLLCIFFGWLGVHKFYERKIALGLLYAFTFGILGIGWIYDIADIAMKKNPYYISKGTKQKLNWKAVIIVLVVLFGTSLLRNGSDGSNNVPDDENYVAPTQSIDITSQDEGKTENQSVTPKPTNTPTNSPTPTLTPTPTPDPVKAEEEYKASCEEYKYKDVLRNPDDYVGKRVKITVKISSVHEKTWLNSTKYYMAYSQSDYGWYGDRYGVFDLREEQTLKLLEDDIITVYGEISDPEYTSSLIVNGSETFCIDMKYIDFISE